MNDVETIAAMRAEVEDYMAELQGLDPSKVGHLVEQVERMDAAITRIEQMLGLGAEL
jgi:hypothetical protein